MFSCFHFNCIDHSNESETSYDIKLPYVIKSNDGLIKPNLYLPLDLDNNSELIQQSNYLVNTYMNHFDHSKQNYWYNIIVTELNPPIHCFGNKIMRLNTFNDPKLNMNTLIDVAYKIFNQYKFYVLYPEPNDTEISIEIHHVNAETRPMDSQLVIHKDNDKSSYYDGHTLIVYVDVDCKGGDLVIYNSRHSNNKQRISTKSDIVGFTRCILLDGECYHKPTPVIKGHRISVLYQFRRNKKMYK